jgi:hypothetical protein
MVETASAATGKSSLIVIRAVEAATAGAPTTRLAGEPGAEATAAAEATRTATPPAPHVEASMPARKSKNYVARRLPHATMTASPPSLHGFAICFSQRNSNLWGSPSTTRSKTQCSGSDATPSPSRTLVAIMTEVPLFPLLPGSIPAYMALVTREVLDRQVRSAQGTVH